MVFYVAAFYLKCRKYVRTASTQFETYTILRKCDQDLFKTCGLRDPPQTYTMLYYAMLYYTLLYDTVLYYTILC